MRFPFITRSHHEAVVSELRRQLEETERERRMVFDRFCISLGVPPLFHTPEKVATAPEADEMTDDSPQPMATLPSKIVGRMGAKKQWEFLKKHHPGEAAARIAKEFNDLKAAGQAAAGKPS